MIDDKDCRVVPADRNLYIYISVVTLRAGKTDPSPIAGLFASFASKGEEFNFV